MSDDECQCDCSDEEDFTAMAEILFDPDYKPQVVPPAVLDRVREFWTTPRQLFRDFTEVNK